MNERERDDSSDLLINVYRHDPLFQKLLEAYEKFQGTNGLHGRKKYIADRKTDIYYYDLNDKFVKIYGPYLECLAKVNFNHKDCFKFMIIIHKKCLQRGKKFLTCRKTYIARQASLNRPTFNRVIKELEEKNMLRIKKGESFTFTPVEAPLAWNVSEEEREEIEKEIARDIKRVDEKWIQEISE